MLVCTYEERVCGMGIVAAVAAAVGPELPLSWATSSPLLPGELSARARACCAAGKLDTDLRYIVWPPETAPSRHYHPCCGAPLSYRLLQRGIASHSGIDTGLVRFATALRERRPVRIAVLGSSVASVPIAGCTAKIDAAAQDWGEVSKRCPVGRGWARMFAEWLDATWPAEQGGHQVYALGRGGCGADCWADCMFTHIPADTELYVLEMGMVLSGDEHAAFEPAVDAAGHSTTSRGPPPPQGATLPTPGAALERILRRLLEQPHPPAVVLLNFFPWCRGGAAGCMAALKERPGYKTKMSGSEWREFQKAMAVGGLGGQAALLNARNISHAEQAPPGMAPAADEMRALRAHDVVETLGRRYSVPVLNTRDALYDAVLTGTEDLFDWATPHLTFTNSFRSELRPGYRMQALAAGLLAEALAAAAAAPPAAAATEPAPSSAAAATPPLPPLPPPLYAENAQRSSRTRSCYAFGFARDYWDAANWLYALRAAPPATRSIGWASTKLGFRSPHTGRQHRRSAMRVSNVTAGAEMEISLDTTPVGGMGHARGAKGLQPMVQLTYATAADGSAQLLARCTSGCTCAGLRINSTGRQLRAKRKQERRRLRKDLAPWEFASLAVSPSTECRLVLTAPPCDPDNGSCGLALLEIVVRMDDIAMLATRSPHGLNRGGHIEL